MIEHPGGVFVRQCAHLADTLIFAVPRKAKMQASLATPTLTGRLRGPKCFSPYRKPREAMRPRVPVLW